MFTYGYNITDINIAINYINNPIKLHNFQNHLVLNFFKFICDIIFLSDSKFSI